jgi:ABC-type uncharacterized transport system ATPase subunit
MNLSETAEYGAIRHLLESPNIRTRTEPFISDDGVDWTALFAEAATMSGGEQVLIRAARDLWQAEGTVGLSEITRGLGASSFQRFIEALAIARGEEVDAENRVLQPA